MYSFSTLATRSRSVGACPRPEAEMNSATTISFLSLRALLFLVIASRRRGNLGRDDIGGKIAELVPSVSEESRSEPNLLGACA